MFSCQTCIWRVECTQHWGTILHWYSSEGSVEQVLIPLHGLPLSCCPPARVCALKTNKISGPSCSILPTYLRGNWNSLLATYGNGKSPSCLFLSEGNDQIDVCRDQKPPQWKFIASQEPSEARLTGAYRKQPGNVWWALFACVNAFEIINFLSVQGK